MSAGLAPATVGRPPTGEYRTRLWMGLGMAIAVLGVLVVDHLLDVRFGLSFYPCLLVCLTLLGSLAALELHALLAIHARPPVWLVVGGTLALTVIVWPVQLGWFGSPPAPWRDLCWITAGLLLLGFLYEMAIYRQPDGAVVRLALLSWMTGYLGLLPAFLALLRWPAANQTGLHGVTALALVIFVPKCGDIGAYFTGRWLGRHPMSPILSPKKTWEGFVGGLLASVLVALFLNRALPAVLSDDVRAALFGLTVGLAGVLGDLAESLIKRDCQQKDASHAVPGFGGVLDVVDSVLFAAPVAYWWLRG